MVRSLNLVDSNSKRKDHFVSRFRSTLDAGTAHRPDIVSLHHWIKGTGNINQTEASFLRDEEDLMSIRSRPDEAQSYFETCAVKAGIKISRIFQKVGARTWYWKATSGFSICARTDRSSIVNRHPKDYPETREFTSPRDHSSGD